MTASGKEENGGQAEAVTTCGHPTLGESGENLEAYYVQNRARLLAFIKSKIDDESLAEDILQDCLLKALRAAPELEDAEKFVSWLYRVLRNAIVDTYRRQAASQRNLDRHALRAPRAELPPDDEGVLCACFVDLLPTLKPEYAEILEAMELGNAGTHEMASRLGITANNLKVRRHRARQQLRERLLRVCRTCAEHGCLDCSCSRSG